MRPEFLHGIGVYSYAHADGWTAVSLPYRGGRLEMVALRPDSGRAACPAIGPAALNLVISRLAAQSVGLAMPKVRLASKADMAVAFRQPWHGHGLRTGRGFQRPLAERRRP